MKLPLAATIGAATLALAGAAIAAPAITVSPKKPCYRSAAVEGDSAGEKVLLSGSGFSANATVSLTRDGAVVGDVTTDATGAFAGELTFGGGSGQATRTYTATDGVNAFLTAQLSLLVSEVDVTLTPERGTPGQKLRVRARGFTTGKTLYAHITRNNRLLVNRKIGRLKGACRTIKARKVLFKRGARFGVYRVQFDTSRRYRSSRPVQRTYEVTIAPRPRRATAQSAWVAVR